MPHMSHMVHAYSVVATARYSVSILPPPLLSTQQEGRQIEKVQIQPRSTFGNVLKTHS